MILSLQNVVEWATGKCKMVAKQCWTISHLLYEYQVDNGVVKERKM